MVFLDPRIGLVLEYCANGTLSFWIVKNRGQIEWVQKLKLLLGIAKGMNFLHTKNIIHRDLKSDNVLLDAALTPKISDFGISRVKDDSKYTIRVGTSSYMAPEILNSEFYDEKCDVFSFAIIMFEVLVETNRPYGNNAFHVEQMVSKNPLYRPAVPLNFNVEPFHLSYMEMMSQCWKHDPHSRPTFEQIIVFVQQELEGLEQQKLGLRQNLVQ